MHPSGDRGQIRAIRDFGEPKSRMVRFFLIGPRPAVRIRTMTDDSQIQQLLDELANSHATPEEVCANCPELLPEVRDRWLQMRRLRADLDALFPPPEKTGPDSPEEPASTRATLPPTASERYVLGDEIARGGMGVIYRATDTALSREVAVKVLQERFAPDSGLARRFADEARIAAQLQHPGIPPVHDLGTLPDGRPFLAMKLIKGQTLEKLLHARTDVSSDRGRFVAIFEQICQAIACAHAHNVIHRDLKPGNVMVGAFGVVQVMDWGLAKVLIDRPAAAADPQKTAAETRVVSLRDSDGPFTKAGSVLGTPAYMPPEQALGAVGKVDRRSDVFGLGGVLAAILTGRAPFAGSAETARVLSAQGNLKECFARLDGCGADPELVALCRRCLAPSPADRPADAEDVACAVAALRAAADERARRAELERVRAEADARAQRQKRRAQLAVAVGLLGLVVIGGSGWLALRGQAAARRADADAAASVALGRAELLASQAGGLDPRTAQEAAAAVAVWEQAEAAAAQAEAPAAACSAEVAGQVADRAADVRQGLERARRDAALLQGLAAVRTAPLEMSGGAPDLANKVRLFRSALTAAGLPARLAEAEARPAAVAAIKAERTGVRTALRSAVDLLLHGPPRAGYNADFEFAAWQQAVDRCDDNPFRREVRGKSLQVSMEYIIQFKIPVSPLAPSRAEPPVGLPDLLRLVERAEAEDPPVDAVVLLSKAFEFFDASFDARLLRLLEVVRDRRPNDPELLMELAANELSVSRVTREPRAFAEALAGFRACIALRPDDAMAYYYLGALFISQGDYAGAVAACRAAIARNPKLNAARNNMANCLATLGDLDGAIAVLRETLQLDPSFNMARQNLGKYLRQKGDLDGAIAEYKEAQRLNPKAAWNHNSLGAAMQLKGDVDGAIAEYKEALRLNTKEPDAIVNLPAAERMRKLLPRLPGVLAGTDRPASPAETLLLAALCRQASQRRYTAAVRLSEEAFAADPGAGGGRSIMSPDAVGIIKHTNRYDAACVAALAGGGAGVDAPSDAADRASLRAKALAWLRADLGVRRGHAASAKPADRETAPDALEHWLTDRDLAGVRDPGPLAKLPAAERREWEKLWQDVKATLADARKPAPPAATDAGKR
jgi:tetratricopeptide (TPR) repeat protein